MFATVEAAIAALEGADGFIVGGGEIYRQSLGMVDVLYATVVHTQIEGADTWFPEYLDAFTEVERDDHSADDRHAYAYSFVRLRANK